MKVAIVTGNGGGLGAEIFRQLREAGWIVPPCDRSVLDVRSAAGVRAFVADVLSDYGRIDVLVNNAAILGPVGPIESNVPDEWIDAIDTNLIGPARLIQSALPIMKKQGGGKIINIAGGGSTNSLPRRSAYAASKAALVRLTECVADEVEQDGISVNAVLPGPLPTAMMTDILAAGPETLGPEAFAAHASLNDDGALDRAASLCLYLASPESDGLTGRAISARYDPWPFDPNTIATIMKSDRYTLRRMNEET